MSDSVSECPVIRREHIVRTLERLATPESYVIAVEGSPGMGKTTLLRQFESAHPENCLSVFLSAASRWAYDPQQVALDLQDQALIRCGAKDRPSLGRLSRVSLSRAFNHLRRRARWDDQTIYFIIDGMEDIPETDTTARQQILEFLPFGMEQFRFIMSCGSSTDIPFSDTVRRHIKDYPLTFFTRDETARYLGELSLDEPAIDQLFKISEGVPGRLASVRRSLTSGRTLSDIVQMSDALDDFLELDWATVDPSSHSQGLLLAILAHDNRAYTKAELAAVAGLSLESVTDSLAGVSFLSTSPEGVVSFSSAAIRRFTSNKLIRYREQVNDLIIEALARDLEGEEALTRLPDYFVNANRLNDLVRYLSPERFAHLYRRTPSLRVVIERAELGIEAATKLKRDDDLVRFTLQRCAIQEIARSSGRVSEVRALTAIGRREEALARAESMVRTEDKFRLLAGIARESKNRGIADDSDLRERIRVLYGQLDPSLLKDHLEETSADLFASLPELALDLISKVAGDSSDNSMDWALTRLAVQAHLQETSKEQDNHIRQVQGRIKDPSLKRLSMSATALMGRWSATQVTSEVEKLDSTGDKLFVLSHWIMANRDREEAADVFESAMAIAVGATQYSVNAKVFRELAHCLPYVHHVHRAKFLVELVDAQRGVLKKIGPTADYVRLQLIIARTLWRWDRYSAQDRFLEIYNEIDALEDLEARTAAAARLAATLSRVDPGQELQFDLHELVNVELDRGVSGILENSAVHFEAVRHIVQALAVACPATALSIIARLNTEWRRDLGYKLFIETVADAPAAEILPATLQQAKEAIASPTVRGDALEYLIHRLISRLSDKEIVGCRDVLLWVIEIEDSRQRLRVSAAVAARLAKASLSKETEVVLSQVWESWSLIDRGWRKLDDGYQVVASLAGSLDSEAARMAREVDELKSNLSIPDEETATAASLGILLSARAFAGLLKYGLDSPEDLQRLLTVISRAGTTTEQTRLLADVAVRCHLVGRKDLAAVVVQEHLHPLLLSIDPRDTALKRRLVSYATPALVVGARASGISLLREMPDIEKDQALQNAALVILRKVPPRDAYEYRPGRGYQVTFEEANEVVELMREMTTDWQLFSLVVWLVESVLGASAANFKQAQRNELARQIDRLADEKFPNARFIQHEGYRIATRTYTNRLKDRSSKISLGDLAERARNIPNISDRAYVIAMIAVAGSTKERRHYIEEARALIDGIPMVADRMDRYEGLSQLLVDIDPGMSSEILRAGIKMSIGSASESVQQRRVNLMDSLWRYFPEAASSFASLADDDPVKQKVENKRKLYQLRDHLGSKSAPLAADVRPKPDDYSQACWMKLALLNAGRESPVQTDRILPILQHAAVQPISDSYPIFALFIENVVRKADGAKDVRGFVLPLFEACLRGAELAILTVERPHEREPLDFGNVGLNKESATSWVGTDHNQVLARLREWLGDHKGGRLYIVDPYFNPDSVELLSLVRDILDQAEVSVLAGKTEALTGLKEPFHDLYMRAWRRRRDDDPPATNLTFASTRLTQKCPIHDRWWLSEHGGLQIGTSFGGIGSRLTSVRILSAEEAATTLSTLLPYFRQERLEHNSERIDYMSFSL